MRPLPIFAFSVSLLIAASSFADRDCPGAFGRLVPYEELPKVRPQSLRADQMLAGESYVAQFRGDIETYKFRFKRREGDEIVYTIDREERRRPIADFHDIRNERGNVATSVEKPLSKSPTSVRPSLVPEKTRKALVQMYHDLKDGVDLSGLLLAPTKLIAEVGSVKVIGKLTATRKVGNDLAREVSTYDSRLTQLGFRLPEKTTIVLNDHPVLASRLGPVDWPMPISIPGRGAAENTLLMNPIGGHLNAARDPSILRHERTHAVLFATYNQSAFVNESHDLQEALADFVAAHMNGDPAIGLHSMGVNRSVRDISRREANSDIRGPGVSRSVPVNGLMDVGTKDPHVNSLLISNALWRVRNAIGEAKLNAVLKPLIDDLNLHRQSAALAGQPGSVIYARSTVEYALTSFRKTLSDRGLDAGEQTLDQLADELGISAARLRDRSSQLKRSGNYAFDGVHQSATSVVLVHAPAVVAMGAAGAAVVYGVNELIPEISFSMTGPRD